MTWIVVKIHFPITHTLALLMQIVQATADNRDIGGSVQDRDRLFYPRFSTKHEVVVTQEQEFFVCGVDQSVPRGGKACIERHTHDVDTLSRIETANRFDVCGLVGDVDRHVRPETPRRTDEPRDGMRPFDRHDAKGYTHGGYAKYAVR